MAFNGSGTFNRLYNFQADRDANIKIRADRMDAEISGIAQGLSQVVTKDGQTTITNNLPMGGFRHTGVGDGAATNDYSSLGQVQKGITNWAVASGSSDAITANYTPAITALVDGQFLFVRAGSANTTTTPTFAPDAMTARTIVKFGGTALAVGDISGAGHELVLRYDLANTRYNLLNPASPIDLTPYAPLASANVFTANQTVRLSDDGSAVGPLLTLDRNSTTPAVNDLIGALLYAGRSSTAVTRTFAEILAQILDATNASEDALLLLQTIVAGTLATRVTVGQGMQVGAPSGGDQGAGTINAVEFYRAGTVLPRLVAGTPLVLSPYTVNVTQAQAHGLTGRPDFYKSEFICTTNDNGYVIGERIQYSLTGTATGAANVAFTLLADATNVTIVTHGSNTPAITNKTSRANANMTAASWDYSITPYKLF